MAHNKNQHFVPQYYFRLFSNGNKIINTLLKSSGEIQENISISKQCSKAYFYGSVEIEKVFGIMEEKHSKLLKDILIINSKDDLTVFLQNHKNHIDLIEIILFQKLRTSLENNKMSEMSEKLAEESLKIHLTAKDNKKLLELLPHVNITLNKKWKQDLLLRQILSMCGSHPSLFDLEVCILNNQTERKFIFSDSPVVLYNKAYRHIKDRGMLGLQSPGLLIFFPISENKCLLFIDKSKYTSDIIDNQFYNITKESDINNINKLQLHHSMHTVYFSDNKQSKQIKKLWKQERNDFCKSYSDVNTFDEVIDGKVSKNSKLMVSYFSQIQYELNLSFLQSNIKTNELINRYRDKELYDILHESREKLKKIEKKTKNLGSV